MKKLLNLIALGLVSALLVGCMRDGKDGNNGVTVTGPAGPAGPAGGTGPAGGAPVANLLGGGAVALSTDIIANAVTPGVGYAKVDNLGAANVATFVRDLQNISSVKAETSFYLYLPAAFANFGHGGLNAGNMGFAAGDTWRFVSNVAGTQFVSGAHSRVNFGAAANTLGNIAAAGAIQNPALPVNTMAIALRSVNAPFNVALTDDGGKILIVEFIDRSLYTLANGKTYIGGTAQITPLGAENGGATADLVAAADTYDGAQGWAAAWLLTKAVAASAAGNTKVVPYAIY